MPSAPTGTQLATAADLTIGTTYSAYTPIRFLVVRTVPSGSSPRHFMASPPQTPASGSWEAVQLNASDNVLLKK